jgi:hypothetical protein
MGGSTSKNIIENSISGMVTVNNEVGQKCTPTVAVNQFLEIIAPRDCPHSKIDVHDIDFETVTIIDVACAQKASQSAEADAAITQKAKQMAESLTQALSLNPASSEAVNIMRMSINVGIAVKNSIQQQIASAASVSQAIKMTGYCDVQLYNVHFKAYTKSLAKAVQESDQVSKASLALQQTADQIAKAKQASLLGPLIIILIVIALVFFGPAKALLKYAEPVLYVAVPALTVWAGYKVYRYFSPKKEGCCAAPVVSHFAPSNCGPCASSIAARETYLPVEFTYPDDPVW